jgi:hypothetical protein
MLNLLTLTRLGSQSEQQQALQEIYKVLNLSTDIIEHIVPSSYKNESSAPNTERALERFQNLIQQHTSSDFSPIVPIEKMPLQSDDDEDDSQDTQQIPENLGFGISERPRLRVVRTTMATKTKQAKLVALLSTSTFISMRLLFATVLGLLFIFSC